MNNAEIEDYEIIAKDGFVIGDRLSNHWLDQIKPDTISKYNRIYIVKVGKHLEVGYMKANFLR